MKVSLQLFRRRPTPRLFSTAVSQRRHQNHDRYHGKRSSWESSITPSLSYTSATSRRFFSYYDDVKGEEEDDGESEEDDFSSMNPWKSLLETPARAAWRATDPHPPERLLDAMEQILTDGDRTPKILKRAYGRVLTKQQDLALHRERDRRRTVNGTISSTSSRAEQDPDNIEPVYYAHEQMLANLKFRLLPNFAVTKRVLEETKSLLPSSFAPRKVIDFGIGCGAASAASLEVFNTTDSSIEWIHGIEPSHSMRECSERLLESVAAGNDDKNRTSTNPLRITFSDTLSPDTASSFDLAICAYTAMELVEWRSSLTAAALLFEKLNPNGVLVLIEPGTPDGFNSLRAIRNMLLDCCPPEDYDPDWPETCHVIAPCTHNGPCPMERHKKNFVKLGKKGYDMPQETSSGDSIDEVEDEDFDEIDWDDEYITDDDDDDEASFNHLSSSGKHYRETKAFNSSFCSFVQSMPGSEKGKGEKFSYLVVQKRLKGEVVDSDLSAFRNIKVSDMLASVHKADMQRDDRALGKLFEQARDVESLYLDAEDDDLGLELLRGDDQRQSMGRIIRAPIKKRGHVYIDYCTSPGRILRERVTKASSHVAPGIYSAARKSRWGGYWPDTSTATKK